MTLIKLAKGGPLLVSGGLELQDADGNAVDTEGKEMVALCRCGESENKPFCDGKHAGRSDGWDS